MSLLLSLLRPACTHVFSIPAFAGGQAFFTAFLLIFLDVFDNVLAGKIS